ncbi:carph-isopro domain-containing protein [Sphingomonas paucimobilis]|uniref:carph-isopro domain-containing protein n=1 Tax=Sphingomonas paucimobilis TaxID=13689 RepID=UPI003B968BA1
MSIRAVITECGGITALSRELGHRNPSTVQGWWDRETIPARWQRAVLAVCIKLGVKVDPLDLMPEEQAA